MIKWLLPLLCLVACGTPKETLHIFTWSEYLDPEVVKAFEEQYHCQVQVDTYESNEAMFAKLKAGAYGYDLVFPTDYFASFMSEQGMLKTLAIENIPNVHYLDWDLLHKLNFTLKETYLPYMIAYTGIGFRSDKIETPTSWMVFSNPSYKGRCTLLNDLREVIGIALMTLGYSANSTNPDQINQAVNLVLDWKPNIAKFEAEQYQGGLASSEFFLAQAYSGVVSMVAEEVPQVKFTIPSEGGIISNDTVAILENAPNPTLAYAFINYLLEPVVALKNMKKLHTLAPNKGVYEKLPPSILEDPAIFPPKEVLEKSEVIRNVGEHIKLYYEAWERIKGV